MNRSTDRPTDIAGPGFSITYKQLTRQDTRPPKSRADGMGKKKANQAFGQG